MFRCLVFLATCRFEPENQAAGKLVRSAKTNEDRKATRKNER